MHRDEAQGWERVGDVCVLGLESLPVDICFLHRKDRAADPAIQAVLDALAEVWELPADGEPAA
jgi:DNA-binding transcriptional LysR family regulator